MGTLAARLTVDKTVMVTFAPRAGTAKPVWTMVLWAMVTSRTDAVVASGVNWNRRPPMDATSDPVPSSAR